MKTPLPTKAPLTGMDHLLELARFDTRKDYEDTVARIRAEFPFYGEEFRLENGRAVKVFLVDDRVPFPIIGAYQNSEGKWYPEAWSSAGKNGQPVPDYNINPDDVDKIWGLRA